ncbi:YqaI family protein [Pseudobacillus badius]|uniref:YqaI family protein n=1 Tax=Bacillus badius TaxID=1455 RepID=UPI001CBB8F63|nr:hypothetical protein [Bacillus badius]UAT28935.1 hypothetical protein K7T73_09825 [Bacillus badius]GLY12683.1 hypothetical protein Bbad01_38990 [Bacillus badius]
MTIKHSTTTGTMKSGYANMVNQPEHVGIDALGEEILIGDDIVEINDDVILEKNLEDYLIEYLGATFKTAE